MASCPKVERKVFEKLPFEIEDFGENDKSKTNIFPVNLLFVGPKRYVMPDVYKECGLDIYNFEVRPDDVFLVGCKRTGTTLHCEMVWQIGNDLDFEGAEKECLDFRFPHIDFAILGTLQLMDMLSKMKDATDEVLEITRKFDEFTLPCLAKKEGRRFIRSHLPLSLLPPQIFEVGAKVIYCARNPKDMLVSLSNLNKDVKLITLTDTFEDYIEDFKNDTGFSWPYVEYVKEGWEKRNDENVLFLFYEDTIKDKRQTIRKVADFLGKNLSEDQMTDLEDRLNIEKFRKNKSVNWDYMVRLGVIEDTSKFIRKGRVGGWEELFDEEMEKKFDQMMEEKLKGTDLKFPEK